MTKVYDLHCHSYFSDGILSPEELVSRAKLRGVSVLALTDHDTVAGVERAQAQADIEGISLVTGIEFSSQWAGRNIHIVGLNLDIHAPDLRQKLSEQAQIREERACEIARKLAKEGIEGALEGARSYAGEGTIGRPHFAKFLVEHQHVTNTNQAFKRYLGAGKIGDIKHQWPDFDEVIDWIQSANGVAVLAHPDKYKMTRTKLCAMVGDFVDAGGKAIELVSGKQVNGVAEKLGKIADAFDLFASCGSDFHFPDQVWQELGNFPPLPTLSRPVWQLWEAAND